MRRIGALLAFGVALAFAASAHAVLLVTPRGALPSVYGNDTLPMIYTGSFVGAKGWVTHHPRVFLIFWGPSWHPSDSVPIAEKTLFRELAGSAYNGLLSQYGVHNDVRLAGVAFDRTQPTLRRPLTRSALGFEAHKVASRHGWGNGRDALWVVLPQSGANMRNFDDECGEHDLVAVRGARWLYNVAVVPPFGEPMYSNPNTGDCIDSYSSDNGGAAPDLVRATTSLTSHEYAEAVTDPNPGLGWATGPAFPLEIADLCAWYSGTPPGLTENVTYLWSNVLHQKLDGCVI
jgi:hypothetical protein